MEVRIHVLLCGEAGFRHLLLEVSESVDPRVAHLRGRGDQVQRLVFGTDDNRKTTFSLQIYGHDIHVSL